MRVLDLIIAIAILLGLIAIARREFPSYASLSFTPPGAVVSPAAGGPATPEAVPSSPPVDAPPPPPSPQAEATPAESPSPAP